MGNIIKITLDGKEYTLEFNRRIILKMEADGLTGEKGDELRKNQPLDFMYKLIRYAFLKNHKELSEEEVDDIVDKIPDLPSFVEAVADILEKSINAFTGEGGDGKNAKWERV